MKDPVSTSEGQANATPSTEQAPDLASIKVQVGDGPDAEMSVDALVSAYKDSRTEMHKAIQAKHELKSQYKWADTFENDLENDPGLRGHLESYYAPQTHIPEQQIQYDAQGEPIVQRQVVQQPATRRASNVPSREGIRLNKVETELHVLSQRESMNDLTRDLKESFGYALTDKQRSAILETVVETGTENVNDIFWGKFGKDVVKSSTTKQTKSTVEKMKENADAYPGSPTGVTSTPGVDVASMSEEQHETHKLQVITDMMRKAGG